VSFEKPQAKNRQCNYCGEMVAVVARISRGNTNLDLCVDCAEEIYTSLVVWNLHLKTKEIISEQFH
jgi:hypothetical protein